ncbi:cellulose synthase operon protein YhjQ/BcsQ [Brevundimonas lutea]|uniref:cellulose synthase operon protein YhjQ/BcsQ n=1 Tax=Brevundimonas lutea TaxID=2293980 RepID=UPI000F032C8F|nr:cellulose synthase operon protein YhjQ/BcsQ [Brevundimonas lutea]
MSSFANQRFDTFEDEFDLDMELGAAPPHPADATASREPLQFLSPAGAAVAPTSEASAEPLPAPAPERPPLASVETSLTPVADPAAGYNPVGELVASAQGALGEVMVPRIAIHVFAERQDTLAAAERAGQDRRLARASTQIRVGGVPAAVESYGHEPTPPLIVVECLSDPQTLLGEIDRLAEVCDMGTKVVVIGATNDILLYRELMRRGVSEYLVAPIQPLQLISAIGGLFSDPAQPFVGRTIAFVGARGGAGSSAVAHNTAYAISERIGANTVIVDYDLPFGTAGLDFNQDPIAGVADALSQPDRVDATLLDRMMVRCTDKLSLFAAPATLDGDWDIPSEAFEEVTNQIRGTAPFVVLDLPHIWSGWMRRTLISADEVVVVATPDLASLRNAKNMIDLIKQARPNDAPPRLVLNQVGAPGRPEIPAKEFGAAIGVHPSLVIPFDAKLFGAAANNGQMILDAGAKSKPAEGFETLAQIVTNRELPAAQTKGAKSGKAAKPAKADKPTAGKGQSIFARFLKR